MLSSRCWITSEFSLCAESSLFAQRTISAKKGSLQSQEVVTTQTRERLLTFFAAGSLPPFIMSQGQFEDAPSAPDPTAPVPAPVPGPSSILTAPLAPQFELAAPREAGVHYLDEDDEDDEEDYDEEWNLEDAQDQEVEDSLAGGLNEVMDQDWDVVSGGASRAAEGECLS